MSGSPPPPPKFTVLSDDGRNVVAETIKRPDADDHSDVLNRLEVLFTLMQQHPGKTIYVDSKPEGTFIDGLSFKK